MRLAFVSFTSAFLIALLIQPQTLSSLAELSYGMGYSVLAAITGLTVKFTTSKLGVCSPSERAAVLDDLIGRLLVRKSAFQTLARIFWWNILLSFAIITSGFISFGVLPVVWIFLNLGVFSAGKGMFMRYTHPWLETAALILSASLGVWGGARLGLLLYHPSIVQPSVFVLILGLHGIAAMLETSETHQRRG